MLYHIYIIPFISLHTVPLSPPILKEVTLLFAPYTSLVTILLNDFFVSIGCVHTISGIPSWPICNSTVPFSSQLFNFHQLIHFIITIPFYTLLTPTAILRKVISAAVTLSLSLGKECS